MIFGARQDDLLNQRHLREIHLDDFEVTHTKDNIQCYLYSATASVKKVPCIHVESGMQHYNHFKIQQYSIFLTYFWVGRMPAQKFYDNVFTTLTVCAFSAEY